MHKDSSAAHGQTKRKSKAQAKVSGGSKGAKKEEVVSLTSSDDSRGSGDIDSDRKDDSQDVEEVKEKADDCMREERSLNTDGEECKEESENPVESLSSSSESDNIINTKTPQTRKRQREELCTTHRKREFRVE